MLRELDIPYYIFKSLDGQFKIVFTILINKKKKLLALQLKVLVYTEE